MLKVIHLFKFSINDDNQLINKISKKTPLKQESYKYG